MLGSEDCEKFILLNKTFSLLCLVQLLSQWGFVNEEFLYSGTACKQEYLAKYRDLLIQETSSEAHIREKSRGKPSVSEEVVDNWDDLRRICKHL